MIQVVKQRARRIVNTLLSYKLATSLIIHLIIFFFYRINLVPHKTEFSNISPSEAFKGREVYFKKDLRVGFGDYAEAMNPHPTIWSSARLKA